MKHTMVTILLLLGYVLVAQQTQNEHKKYTKTASGYLMVLQQGDDILKELEKLTKAENIPSGSFTGLGFVNIKFGFFDFTKKEYRPKDFNNVELASMQGSIAWQDGNPSLHAHGVVGDEDFKAHAGHILSAQVSTGTLEIWVTVNTERLERKKDEKLGATVLEIRK